MSEVPVLVHGDLKLSQSGVMLDDLAFRTGKFAPENHAGHQSPDQFAS
jgi:glutathione S-transferase